ncbi:Uncharacterised protein [Mycobacteroides abscessus subsp. massiliense]|nr:Uncharacterised protein [Mycobacteroides abscessus subsp. massiliense]
MTTVAMIRSPFRTPPTTRRRVHRSPAVRWASVLFETTSSVRAACPQELPLPAPWPPHPPLEWLGRKYPRHARINAVRRLGHSTPVGGRSPVHVAPALGYADRRHTNRATGPLGVPYIRCPGSPGRGIRWARSRIRPDPSWPSRRPWPASQALIFPLTESFSPSITTASAGRSTTILRGLAFSATGIRSRRTPFR